MRYRTVCIPAFSPCYCMTPSAAGSVSVEARHDRVKTLLRSPAFDAKLFLDSVGPGRKLRKFQTKEAIFTQGEPAKNVMYVQEGGIRLTVVNKIGREAVVAILGRGDFFGEGCLAGQSICMATATAIGHTTILSIAKEEMLRLLHKEHELSDRFISYMLTRNNRVEEDLIDQLFNSSERRLARTLLLLARYGKQDQPQQKISNVSQGTLADMIGTTRSRVSFFMNKFKRLGYLRYKNNDIRINKGLLNVVLHD